MKLFVSLPAFLFCVNIAIAQPAQQLEENKPQLINGMEASWRINQESTKKSGDTEYSRYMLEFSLINRSDCNKYIPYRSGGYSSSSESLVATFYVRNANGKRFTSTSANVSAGTWWVKVKVTEKDRNGKDITQLRDMQAGYVFRRGDQLRQQITVLVPRGELPKIEMVLQNNNSD